MIYSPIWVDQFSPRNVKTVFMAVQQVASPLGVVLGYALTYIVKKTIVVFTEVIDHGRKVKIPLENGGVSSYLTIFILVGIFISYTMCIAIITSSWNKFCG